MYKCTVTVSLTFITQKIAYLKKQKTKQTNIDFCQLMNTLQKIYIYSYMYHNDGYTQKNW